MAEANGYPDSRWLLLGGRPAGGLLEALTGSDVASPDGDETSGAEFPSVRPVHLDFGKPQVCAMCLAEGAWIRAVWALCSYVACRPLASGTAALECI